MSIDYQAMVIVGLPRKELSDCDSLSDWIDEEELTVCSPYYDGGDSQDAIIGIEVQTSGTYKPSILEWDQEKIDKLKEEFKTLTGLDAKVWISPYGW